MINEDYKWTIEYNNQSKQYEVRGFVKVEGKWSLDGAAQKYPDYEKMLLSIHAMIFDYATPMPRVAQNRPPLKFVD